MRVVHGWYLMFVHLTGIRLIYFYHLTTMWSYFFIIMKYISNISTNDYSKC